MPKHQYPGLGFRQSTMRFRVSSSSTGFSVAAALLLLVAAKCASGFPSPLSLPGRRRERTQTKAGRRWCTRRSCNDGNDNGRPGVNAASAVARSLQRLQPPQAARTRQRRSTTRCFGSGDGNDNESGELQRPDDGDIDDDSTLMSRTVGASRKSVPFSILMALSGAALGPFLDSYHSAFGVLQYDKPISLDLWASLSSSTSSQPALITSWWVPPLFGLAGFIIGWLYIVLDDLLLLRRREQQAAAGPSDIIPSPPKVLIGISIFTFQYWLSGLLYHSGFDRTYILNVMSVIAACGFYFLDNTTSGLITSAATAIGGPVVEAGLLTLSRAGMMMGGSGYHYNDPGETGFFPLWIVPVYFLGGPAVGNLARGYWHGLLSPDGESGVASSEESKPPPGCTVCNDTRRVPCPNCDGVGTYTAMGGKTVECMPCRGRGFVICRSCFDYYGEDPNDIKAIRELMKRMPD